MATGLRGGMALAPTEVERSEYQECEHLQVTHMPPSRPNHFITGSKLSGDSVIKNLYSTYTQALPQPRPSYPYLCLVHSQGCTHSRRSSLPPCSCTQHTDKPLQNFYISGAFGLTMRGILIDMKNGYQPVPGAEDLELGHNTDGFDISSSTLV